MSTVAAAWSQQAQEILGPLMPRALEAFAHNATVREILKIHGPDTTLWVQAAEREGSLCSVTGSYQTREGDSVGFKTVLPLLP